MNRRSVLIIVLGLVLALMAPTAFAGDSVKTWGDSLIYRDGNGKETKLRGPTTVTPGAIWNMPLGAGGTLAGIPPTDLAVGSILNGVDGQMAISTDAGGGSVGWVDVSLTGDTTGSMVNTGALDTTTSFINGIPLGGVSNAATNIIIADGRALQNAIMGGDVLMAVDGAVTIQDNVVGVAETNYTLTRVNVAIGAVFGNVTTTAGSYVVSCNPVANVAAAALNNTCVMNGSSAEFQASAANGAAVMVWNILSAGP